MFKASFRRRSSATLERDVTVRMIRQERLTSVERPLQLHALIEESALHRPVGGPTIMRDQFARLVTTAALDTVTLQVLPTGIGAHPGIDGAFTVLSFEGLGEPDTAYLEHPVGSVHVEKDEDVTLARLVFDHLRTVAHSPAESVALIERVAAQM
jgi:hypothetical protein